MSRRTFSNMPKASMQLFLRIAAGLCLLEAANGQSIPKAASAPPPALPAETNGIMRTIDQSRANISEYLQQKSDDLDRYLDRTFTPEGELPSETFIRFMGDRRLESDDNRTRIRLSPSIEFTEGGSIDVGLKFSGKISLPRTEDRLEIIVGNLNEESDVLEDFTDTRSRERRVENEGNESAGIRIHLLDRLHYRVDADAGLDFDPAPMPKLKLRGRVSTHLADWHVDFSEQIFWEAEDGFGAKTQLEFKKRFGEPYIFRTSSAGVWSETSQGVDLGQSFSLYRHSGHHRSIGTRFGIYAHTRPSTVVDSYNLRFPYRQRLHRNWLYLEIEPGADFPRERDWAFTPLLVIKLDIYFGDAPGR